MSKDFAKVLFKGVASDTDLIIGAVALCSPAGFSVPWKRLCPSTDL